MSPSIKHWTTTTIFAALYAVAIMAIPFGTNMLGLSNVPILPLVVLFFVLFLGLSVAASSYYKELYRTS